MTGKVKSFWGGCRYYGQVIISLQTKGFKMKRNMEVAAVLLDKLIASETKGPCDIRQFFEEPHFAAHIAMLLNAGFIVKVEIPDNTTGIDYYRSTWKGQCFVDLYMEYIKHEGRDFDDAKTKGTHPDLNVSLLAATYHVALLSFY